MSAVLDQSEIDSLLNSLNAMEAPALAPAPAASSVATPSAQCTDPGVRRVLRLRVPVMVELARKRMSISELRHLSPGAIIEFERSIDSDLGLLINNAQIGTGQCVKVGENFGLRVVAIQDRRQRVISMGGP